MSKETKSLFSFLSNHQLVVYMMLSLLPSHPLYSLLHVTSITFGIYHGMRGIPYYATLLTVSAFDIFILQ